MSKCNDDTPVENAIEKYGGTTSSWTRDFWEWRDQIMRITPLQELKRTVCTCMLWEHTYYEASDAIASRIVDLVHRCNIHDVASLAIKLRKQHNLRHVPLLLMRELARHRYRHRIDYASLLASIITRADEMGEFLCIYREHNRKEPIANPVKKGLAKAFAKFDEYQLAKYNSSNSYFTLKDILRIVHPKPTSEAQRALWGRVKSGKLTPPNTWERRLSSGENPKDVWEDLLINNQLGYLALLRNIKIIYKLGVSVSLIRQGLATAPGKDKVLPYRYITAGNQVPALVYDIDVAMLDTMSKLPKLSGKTVILVDVSSSMSEGISLQSSMTRMRAAVALAILIRGVSEEVVVYTFSSELIKVPSYQGYALGEAILRSQEWRYTDLAHDIKTINVSNTYDRIVVITDEQPQDDDDRHSGPHQPDVLPDPLDNARGYLINVSPYKRGVSYNRWVHINGFSESIVPYIMELESLDTSS